MLYKKNIERVSSIIELKRSKSYNDKKWKLISLVVT